MKPSIKKGIIITSICAFTLVGIKFYLNSTNKIDVNSVSTLNTGYWDNPSTSTGLVSNSDRQSVLYDASKTITQVFVQEGQQVNSGDPLLSYDLTTLQSAVDTSQLDVEKAQNAIALAEHELKKLQRLFQMLSKNQKFKIILLHHCLVFLKKMEMVYILIFYLYHKLKRISRLIKSITLLQQVKLLKKGLMKRHHYGKKKEK